MRRSRRSSSASASNSSMCRSCSAASSRRPTTSRRPRRSPASRTSANSTQLETERFVKRFKRQALCLESVLPGQHAEPDARRDRGADGGRVREICRGRLPSHVARAEEDGRSGSRGEGAGVLRPRCRKTVRPRAGPRGQGQADREHRRTPSSAARSARRPSSSATRCSSARSSCARSRRWCWRSSPFASPATECDRGRIPDCFASRRNGDYR